MLFGGRTSSGEIKYISKLSLHVEYPEKQKQKENEEEEDEDDEAEPTISIKLDKVS